MVQETVAENVELDFNTVLIDSSKAIHSILDEIATNNEIQEHDNPIEYLELCSSFRPAMPVMITMQRLETLDVSDDEDDFSHTSEITILDDDKDFKKLRSILACHSVRVGSYKVCSRSNMRMGGDFGATYLEKPVDVIITPKGVQIKVPEIIDDNKMVFIFIPMTNILTVFAHYGKVMPALFIDISPDACEKVRKSLNMKDSSPFFFDVTSEDETVKRITILPEKLNYAIKFKIKKVFGNKFSAINIMEAREILARCTPRNECLGSNSQQVGKECQNSGVNNTDEQIRCSLCNRGFNSELSLSLHHQNSGKCGKKLENKNNDEERKVTKERSKVGIMPEVPNTFIQDKDILIDNIDKVLGNEEDECLARSRSRMDQSIENTSRRKSPDSQVPQMSSSIEIVLEFTHSAVLKDKPVVHKSGITHTHDWHLVVRAAEGGKCEYYLEKVVFCLYKTFDNATRVVNRPPFEVKESGYGSFTVPVDLYFKSQDKLFRKARINYKVILQPNKEVAPPKYPGFRQKIRMCSREKITIPGTVDEDFRRKLIKGGGKEVDLTVPPTIGSSSSIKKNSSKLLQIPMSKIMQAGVLFMKFLFLTKKIPWQL
jgi:transcription initiation factor IIF auxiliary subunit